ncbi:MAG: NAD(P)-dependent dehydrogenase (short-subunit alcohol dehydrogenase family) [Paracoccaceae bacterium]|jgi:NAD(P)-dependent dehydrogenase (short-subunit alcohol dehydrogenase family)
MLEDKVVVVTGGGRGLGQAYAIEAARLGAKVVAGDILDCGDTIQQIEANGGTAIGVELDVTKMGTVTAMAESAMEAFGAMDVLINNAALYGGLTGGRFDMLDEDEWDNTMNVNVKGIWNCCKAVVPHMKTAGRGSIINVASLAATYGLPYALHYTTSKAAVIGMTRGLARELGRNEIRVNAIAPTAVLTEGTAEFFGDKTDGAMETIMQDQSLKRNPTPDDMIGTVMWLASDASGFVTGQTIAIDGGTVMS